MNGQQVLEWGKRFLGPVGTQTRRIVAAVIGMTMIATMAIAVAPTRAEAAEPARVADPTTFTQWEQGTDPGSTGRVWTDKSVSTDAVTLTTYTGEPVTVAPKHTDKDAFLVGLSAMSSAQRITGVVNVTKPLDIVLVLDTSGSMEKAMDGGTANTYTEVYSGDLDKTQTYYIRNGWWSYREVTWDENSKSWGYSGNQGSWNSVTPKTSANDYGHTQFYEYSYSRMFALQQAVNGFIDQTAKANASVSDPNKKNRIGLVTYACKTVDDQCKQGSSVRSGLTDNFTALQTTVNGLYGEGATYADEGLSLANNVLNTARADAKKVVIFFTDGEPGYSGFDGTVANAAIAQAKLMKKADASVYSIGIFAGANPSANMGNVTNSSDSTQKANAFMQGVSSNYPKADGFTTTQLGQKASGEYYLAASDANKLNLVFETIWDEVSSALTSPIQSSTPGSSGVVRFTDQLGDYMHVLRMNSIVCAGKKFTQFSKTTSGNTTTYVFAGTVEANEIYKTADLSTMRITVQSFDTGGTPARPARQGDLVTVDVPEELLPLRLYSAKVNADGTVKTQITPTDPMRLFYEVGLKDGVKELVSKPDADMTQYIAANKDANGIRFLTNRYDGQPNEGYGDTTAVFTPATTNDFYYFTQDTPLYNSESLDSPATEIHDGSTYYYQRVFYADNARNEQWIRGTAAELAAVQQNQTTRQWYVPAGTPRTTLANQYTREKSENPTNTAKYASSPQWADTQVDVRLGNNGVQRIRIPAEATPEFTKTISGRDWKEDESFTFTLAPDEEHSTVDRATLEAAMPGNGDPVTVTVTETNANGFGLGTFTFGKSGTYVYTITETNAGQTIDGLTYASPATVVFSVTETNAGAYTYTVDTTVTGIDDMTFVNAYEPAPVQVQMPAELSKELRGVSSWDDDWRFRFTLTDTTKYAEPTLPQWKPGEEIDSETNPLSCDVDKRSCTVSVGKPDSGLIAQIDFGTFTFVRKGVYTYDVTEIDDSATQGGIYYDTHTAQVTITVTDDGNGTLTATTSVDDGAFINTAGVELPSTGGRREQGMITLALAIVFLLGAAGCALRLNRVTMGG